VRWIDQNAADRCHAQHTHTHTYTHTHSLPESFHRGALSQLQQILFKHVEVTLGSLLGLGVRVECPGCLKLMLAILADVAGACVLLERARAGTAC